MRGEPGASRSQAGGQPEGPPAAEVVWQPVAPLSALMQQVPIVNNSLRRGLEANRFKRQQKQSAVQSATLAAIAQVAAYDLSAADDDTAAQWQTLCREMRDGPGGSTRLFTATIWREPRQARRLWLRTAMLATRRSAAASKA